MNTLSRSLLVPGLCAVLAACAMQPTPPRLTRLAAIPC